MLNERDLELIGGVVTKAIEPVREEVKELRKDVTELQVGMKELRADVTELQVEVKELRADVTELQVEVKELRKDVTKLQGDVVELQTGMEKLSTDVERLGRKTEKIEFIMENELRPNICKIAEGHLDLSRKLDMVRVRRSEYILMDIKISGLQLDIREIKNTLKIA